MKHFNGNIETDLKIMFSNNFNDLENTLNMMLSFKMDTKLYL